jgi:hypothetical protein
MILTGERKNSGCHFFHQKSLVGWTGNEPEPLHRKSMTNRLSHGTAYILFALPFPVTLMNTIRSIKGKGKVVPLRSTEAHLCERRYSSYSFLTSALEWSASRPRPPFTPGTHCTGGWVGPRDGLDAEVRGKILCTCRWSNPGRPVRSQTLYWLSYLAHYRAPETWDSNGLEDVGYVRLQCLDGRDHPKRR